MFFTGKKGSIMDEPLKLLVFIIISIVVVIALIYGVPRIVNNAMPK